MAPASLLFSAVGLGLALEASLSPPPHPSRPVVFAGPTREGEVVDVELRY